MVPLSNKNKKVIQQIYDLLAGVPWDGAPNGRDYWGNVFDQLYLWKEYRVLPADPPDLEATTPGGIVQGNPANITFAQWNQQWAGLTIGNT